MASIASFQTASGSCLLSMMRLIARKKAVRRSRRLIYRLRSLSSRESGLSMLGIYTTPPGHATRCLVESHGAFDVRVLLFPHEQYIPDADKGGEDCQQNDRYRACLPLFC